MYADARLKKWQDNLWKFIHGNKDVQFVSIQNVL